MFAVLLLVAQTETADYRALHEEERNITMLFCKTSDIVTYIVPILG